MQRTELFPGEKRIPESWYDLVPDLPFQLGPGAGLSVLQGAFR